MEGIGRVLGGATKLKAAYNSAATPFTPDTMQSAFKRGQPSLAPVALDEKSRVIDDRGLVFRDWNRFDALHQFPLVLEKDPRNRGKVEWVAMWFVLYVMTRYVRVSWVLIYVQYGSPIFYRQLLDFACNLPPILSILSIVEDRTEGEIVCENCITRYRRKTRGSILLQHVVLSKYNSVARN